MSAFYVFNGLSGQAQWRQFNGGTAAWSQPAGPPTNDPGRNVSHVLDALEHQLWVAHNASGTDVNISRWKMNSSGIWAVDVSANISSIESPSLSALSCGAVSLCYVESGTAKRCLYDAARGQLHVVTIGSGTLVDHCIDEEGRIIAMVYDGEWKVSVGTLGSDGVTYTFSTPTSTSLGGDEVKGSVKMLPHGKISFMYVDGSVAHATCPKQPSTGSGTWS